MKTVNTLILSGCLAKQDFQKESEGKIDLVFHHYLNEMLSDKYNTELNVSIMRYDRYNTTFERFLKYFEKHNPELIIIQLRHYHFLRLIGLRSYFIDDNNRCRRDFNFPFLKPFSNEIYNPFMIYSTEYPEGLNTKIESTNKFIYNVLKKIYYFFHGNQIRNTLEQLNPLFGLIIGNYYFAINEYNKLIEKMMDFTKQNNLPLFFLSPSPKPVPFIDYKISEMLYKDTKKYIEKRGYDYIDVFRKYSDNGEYLFLNDNLHLNTIAHQFIAKQLFPVVEKNILSK